MVTFHHCLCNELGQLHLIWRLSSLEAFHGDASPLYEKITYQSFQSVADELFGSSYARRASLEGARRTFRTLSPFPVKRNAADGLFTKQLEVLGGEGDYLINAVRIGKQHDQSVKTQRVSGSRRH